MFLKFKIKQIIFFKKLQCAVGCVGGGKEEEEAASRSTNARGHCTLELLSPLATVQRASGRSLGRPKGMDLAGSGI